MKTCVKCKEEKPLIEFNKNKSTKDGYQKYCKLCKAISDKKWIDENPSIWKESNKNRNNKINQILSELRIELGGKCKKCDEDREHLLDFHHLDPKKKSFEITSVLYYYGYGKKALQLVRKEIKKCILLCSNCHRDFHYLEKKEDMNIEKYLN